MSSMSPTRWVSSAALSRQMANSIVPSTVTVKPSRVRKVIASSPLISKRWLCRFTSTTLTM